MLPIASIVTIIFMGALTAAALRKINPKRRLYDVLLMVVLGCLVVASL